MARPPLARLALAVPLALGAAAPAAAQSVADCDTRASARFLAEPWEKNTATFADGEVRVAAIDMTEPTGAPAYLMILSPPRDAQGERQCRIVEAEPDYGFYTVDLQNIVAEGDTGDGILTLRVPVTDYADGPENPPPFPLTVTLDQATGEVTATTE